MDQRQQELQRIQQESNGAWREAGTIPSSVPGVPPQYYEIGNNNDPNRVDIFRQGMPQNHHSVTPHPHWWGNMNDGKSGSHR